MCHGFYVYLKINTQYAARSLVNPKLFMFYTVFIHSFLSLQSHDKNCIPES